MSYDHKKLGISFAELGALLGTRALLAAEALKHTPYRKTKVGAHLFNMAIICDRDDECGTVSCIGGTMALIMGMDHDQAEDYVAGILEGTPTLRPLFYPDHDFTDGRAVEYHPITTKQAIAAIDNFLKGRGPQWKKVLRLR